MFVEDEILDISTPVDELSICEEIVICNLVTVLNEAVVVPLAGFRYDGGTDNKPPRVLVFGRYAHHNTGSPLLCGLNLNKLSESEIQTIANTIPYIIPKGGDWEDLNTKEKYWAFVGFSPEVAQIVRKCYRTYIEPKIVGEMDVVAFDVPEPQAPEQPTEKPAEKSIEKPVEAKPPAAKPAEISPVAPEKPVEAPKAVQPPKAPPVAPEAPKATPEAPKATPQTPPKPEISQSDKALAQKIDQVVKEPEPKQATAIPAKETEIDTLKKLESQKTKPEQARATQKPSGKPTRSGKAALLKATGSAAREIEKLKGLEDPIQQEIDTLNNLESGLNLKEEFEYILDDAIAEALAQ